MDDELLYFAAVHRTLVPKWSTTPRGPEPTKINT
jgi:hypothetical protein